MAWHWKKFTLLMLFLIYVAGTMWELAVLPEFQETIALVLVSQGLIIEAVWFSETSETQPAFILYQHPKKAR
jgi:hypothetical protein